jgi:phosphohistidine phosphatase
VKRLTLIRHAKSSWAEPNASDFDRELNQRGADNAPEMGRRLQARGCRPDAIVSSPARRAMTTATIFAGEIDFAEENITTDRRIYEASVGDLVAVSRGLDDAWNHVVLFGHNPGFTYFANLLADAEIQNIPTCGVVDIECDIASWSELKEGCGRLREFDFPKNQCP